MACQVEIVKGKQGMKDFFKVPYLVYHDDPKWIAPLQSETERMLDANKNPYFRNSILCRFVCYRDKLPVSRAVAVINFDYWKRWGNKTAFFGFYESIYDQEATTELFVSIEKFCRDHGAESLEGPFNPNHYSELGLLVKNFEEPRFFEPYNPTWYLQRLQNAGFSISKTVYTRLNTKFNSWVNCHHPEVNLSGRLNGYRIRPFSFFRYRKDMEAIREINNDAFSENQWFLPLSAEEYSFSSRLMFLVTSPKLIRLIEYNNEPVGVLQTVYNVNPVLRNVKGFSGLVTFVKFLLQRHKMKEVIIYAAGVKKHFRHSPAVFLLHNEVCRLSEKFSVVSTTWMTDDNQALFRTMEKLGMQPYKWFVLLKKSLIEKNEEQEVLLG
jgi:hypothetical protein